MNDGVKILAVARPSRELESLAVELGDAGETWPIDATGDEFLERVEALDRLDILVNNLGTNRPMPIGQVSDDDLAVMIEMNVRAPFRTCRSAIGRMENGGVIVNISSQMGHVGSPNRSVYCMTKHALEGLTKALAVELAPRNIRVNAVAPTFIETPMTRPMFENPEFAKFVMDRIPLGRLGQVEDVAAAVRYLCSPTASMITGHSLLIDGGWTAQ
jgi:NAD(P)-dependent dehydrogenase (short-subunit alcohol dehydrogenase family)